MVAKTKIKRTHGQGLRELRPVKIKTKVNRYAEGSCLIEMGHTQVLCLATVEDEVPPWRMELGEGWVTSEYAMLPRATHSRSGRESVRGKLGGRTQEISRLIGRSLRAAVDYRKLGPRTITVDCEVLQADGGTRCAGITGGYVALALACHGLMQKGTIPEWPLTQQIAAVSVGIFQGLPILDLAYEEDSRAEVDMNVVMGSTEKFIEIQGTAEQEPFSIEEANQMMELAAKGIKELIQLQAQALKKLRKYQ